MPKRLMTIARILCTVCLLVQVVFGSVAITECNPAPATPDPYGLVKEKITELIKAEMKKTKTVGLSIALVDDQQTVWLQGFGFQDNEKNIPASASTIYQVGSITKLFTVIAAMQQAEQGKLDIDQPLKKYLPEFSIKSRFADTQPITARTIMTHHSGIPSDYWKGFSSATPYSELVQSMQTEFAAYPPNYIFSYSNVAMTLLGHTVAKVSGKEYQDFVQDELLKPIGMQKSFITSYPPTENPLMSKSYSKGKENKMYPLRDTPAGGLCANVEDMGRFMQMIFAGGSVWATHCKARDYC